MRKIVEIEKIEYSAHLDNTNIIYTFKEFPRKKVMRDIYIFKGKPSFKLTENEVYKFLDNKLKEKSATFQIVEEQNGK